MERKGKLYLTRATRRGGRVVLLSSRHRWTLAPSPNPSRILPTSDRLLSLNDHLPLACTLRRSFVRSTRSGWDGIGIPIRVARLSFEDVDHRSEESRKGFLAQGRYSESSLAYCCSNGRCSRRGIEESEFCGS